MAERREIVQNGKSAEEIAYQLFELVAQVEKRSLLGGSDYGFTPADRNYILSTYSECLRAVRFP